MTDSYRWHVFVINKYVLAYKATHAYTIVNNILLKACRKEQRLAAFWLLYYEYRSYQVSQPEALA